MQELESISALFKTVFSICLFRGPTVVLQFMQVFYWVSPGFFLGAHMAFFLRIFSGTLL